MEYEMTNDITLPGRKPYKLAGQLNRNPRDFRLGAQDLSLRKTEVAKVCFVPTDIETVVSNDFLLCV
jgi:hypothetical protein